MSETTVAVPAWALSELDSAYARLRDAVAALADDAGPYGQYRLKMGIAHMQCLTKFLDPSIPTLAEAGEHLAESVKDLSEALSEYTDRTTDPD